MSRSESKLDRICYCLDYLLIGLGVVSFMAVLLYVIIMSVIGMSNLAEVTVNLVDAQGFDVDEQIRTTPVEFDVAIGFLHLKREFAMGHDGGHVKISYAGVNLAEGPVPRFYVAGGPKRVEGTRTVASAGKDQASLSQMFREHLWVDQQLDGEIEFDIDVSFYDVDVTTGKTTYSYHSCKVGLALHGKARATKCGHPNYL